MSFKKILGTLVWLAIVTWAILGLYASWSGVSWAKFAVNQSYGSLLLFTVLFELIILLYVWDQLSELICFLRSGRVARGLPLEAVKPAKVMIGFATILNLLIALGAAILIPFLTGVFS